MILHVAPGSPGWDQAATTALLTVHVGAGALSLAAGAAALIARKGGRAHGLAGTIFVVAMLTMSGIGAAVAPYLPQRLSSVAGAITFYLTATAWMTVRRPAGTIGRFEVIALAVALAAAIADATLALQGLSRADRLVDGQSPEPGFVFGALSLFAAGLDLNLVLRGGLSGRNRVARHLWRMCAALFIAATSLFLGQPQVFPAVLRGSPVLMIPELAVLGAMIFWLARVRAAAGARRTASDAG